MPEPRLLHQFFERAVAHHADRIAIDVPPGFGRPARHTVSYGHLARMSGALAEALRSRIAAARPRPPSPAGAAESPIVVILMGREAADLYAAQLAALASGCAYAALDPRFPDAHLAAAIADATPPVVITDAHGATRLAALGIAGERVLIAAEAVTASPQPAHFATMNDAPPPDEPQGAGADPADRLAYLIYTSGTTGRPKGVEITHRGIVNLVASDLDRFRVGPDDRVAQCSSPAYDSSVEETWLALAAGATLVPLDDDTVRLGPDLVPWLQRERITVLCPPPTLLRATGCSDPERALPALRLLYVGGEALPDDLARRWAAGRWMENGYGPTECTVTVVRGRVVPGRTVTIGRPVRGHRAWVVDESLEEVPDGEPGELLIAGPGLARGYRGLPALTAERFPIHSRFGRVYRTGDLVRRIPAAERNGTHGDELEGGDAGELEYLGRLDSQIKLRGYRIELTAIESLLATHPGVRAAACTTQREGERELLVAHVVEDAAVSADAARSGPVATAGRTLDLDGLLGSVRAALPEYMVPARIATIDRLPTTVGGKLDRRALPRIPPGAAGPATPGEPAGGQGETGDRAGRREPSPASSATDALERIVLDAFSRALLPGEPDRGLSATDDFFLDLGGDSLSAVAVLCELRRTPETASLTVRDLYGLRTAARIAEHLRGEATRATAAANDHAAVPRAAVATWPCTLVQACWILLGVALAGMASAAAILLLPDAFAVVSPELLLLLSPFLAVVAGAAWMPLAVLLTVLLKWALIGRYTEGRHPLWGSFYLRHWIVVGTARLIPWGAIAGTALTSVVLRALGAKVGRRVVIHRGVDLSRGGWDLLSLGDDVTLGQDSALRLVSFAAGQMVVAPITLCDGVTVDVRGGVSGPATVGRNAMIGPLSCIESHTEIAAEELWSGVPAAREGRSPAAPHPGTAVGGGSWLARSLSPGLYALLVLLAGALRLLVPGLMMAGVVLLLARWAPAQRDAVVAWVGSGSAATTPDAATLASLLAAVLMALPCSLVLQAIAIRTGGRIAPGVYGAFSVEAVRIWLVTGAVERAGRWLSGSLLWPCWLRLAGMRIGRDCEISTIIDVLPATVTIGERSFFADGIYFCSPWRHRGAIVVRRSELGSDTFLGNHAVVPAGPRYAEGLFVGVSTLADASLMRGGGDWFGMPPIALPRRQVQGAARHLTHEPGLVRYANRLFWELLRFALPALPIVVGAVWLEVLMRTASPRSILWWCGLVPAIALSAAAAPCLAIVALKWILLGRTRPGEHPLWSCWCSRWDFLFVAWGFWARAILGALEGTLLLNAFLRLTGVRIGRRVFLGPGFTQVVDPDMLEFESGATVMGHLQAHSFEDRILKMDRLHLRRGATLGEDAVIFYGAEIGAGAVVLPHAVVMKRDRLAAGSVFEGCPCRPRREAMAGGSTPTSAPQAGD